MQFVDTNILFYAAGLHPESPEKAEVALSMLSSRETLAISVQVLQEFFDKSTRRARHSRLSDDEAIAFLNTLRTLEIVPLTAALFDQAIAIKRRTNFRYWDCAIIAAALSLGCDTLYSEDMQHGQIIDGLTIINPFL